jgi:CheY-like chemotaxis protein
VKTTASRYAGRKFHNNPITPPTHRYYILTIEVYSLGNKATSRNLLLVLMRSPVIHLMLADDDVDDCMFFEEALKELPFDSNLQTVPDGEQLMTLLTAHPAPVVDILFLDLNMPRKTGYECLTEIKENDRLKDLPIIIFSTSVTQDMAESLYQKGALYYIRKPGDFAKLKKIIFKVLTFATSDNAPQRTKDNFIIEA